MRCDILTLFPELIPPYLNGGILGRAYKRGQLDIQTHNIRDFSDDTHRTVDDTPYGGGAGMVMKIEPIDRCLQTIKKDNSRVIVLSAKGRPFTQHVAHEYSKQEQLIFICGRYEGIDQRVIDHLADEELSIGPYVLAGGELPTLVVLETVARLLPGVLGNPESLKEESFGSVASAHLSEEYPHYTKPAEYKGWKVPDVLLSGNHEAIKKWREEQQKRKM
jgi:tRNA (guanine37-N1)-methyltransferase